MPSPGAAPITRPPAGSVRVRSLMRAVVAPPSLWAITIASVMTPTTISRPITTTRTFSARTPSSYGWRSASGRSIETINYHVS